VVTTATADGGHRSALAVLLLHCEKELAQMPPDEVREEEEEEEEENNRRMGGQWQKKQR
jgi:hypothetical protein